MVRGEPAAGRGGGRGSWGWMAGAGEVCSVSVQYQFSISAVSVQYQFSISSVSVQFQFSGVNVSLYIAAKFFGGRGEVSVSVQFQ